MEIKNECYIGDVRDIKRHDIGGESEGQSSYGPSHQHYVEVWVVRQKYPRRQEQGVTE